MSPIDHLRPGERRTYFTGELAALRAKDPDDPQIAAADAAWEMALAGPVDLAQRRRPDGGLDYVAVGRHRTDRQPVKPAVTTQNYRKKLAA